MRTLINILMTTIIIFVLSQLGWFVHVDSLTTALVVAALLMILRALVKVVSMLLAFLAGGVGFAIAGPLGALMLVVVPLFIFIFASSYAMLEIPRFVSGFMVNGFWAAFFTNFIIGVFTTKKPDKHDEERNRRYNRWE